MTGRSRFPVLDADAIAPTRDALHAYSKVIGSWADGARQRRKHWWHLSLRPSIRGLTTDVIRGAPDFELEIDLVNSRLDVHCAMTSSSLKLCGQSARGVSGFIRQTLEAVGVEGCVVPDDTDPGDDLHAAYSARCAGDIHEAFAAVAACLEDLRAGIREETSPIQLWPHHFDLSMIWLPGTHIAGVDYSDEESADKQMNFGFVLGDAGIPEPYFYVTAFPHPDEFRSVVLPDGTAWNRNGFQGAVLRYRDLVAMAEPEEYLGFLWNRLLAAGREHLCDSEA